MNKIALIENGGKPDAQRWALFAAKKIIDLGGECCIGEDLHSKLDDKYKEKVKICDISEAIKFADAVITFGGDGTMLEAARDLLHNEIPIMGVNVGKLGFLAEYQTEGLEKSIQDVTQGNYRLVDRAVLETEIQGEKFYALNDFVIEKRNSSRVMTVETYSDEYYVGSYRVDGIILTTPTGSTAYSLSCDGPIIAPSTKVLCITPISPHTLTLRPLVIPDTNVVSFIVDSPSGESSLVADGHREKSLSNGDKVIIKTSDLKVKFIKPQNVSYYDVLRNKLLWGAHSFDSNIKITKGKSDD
jgi:NAD+ kinase